VRVSREEELLGTAGGLARARDLLGEGDVLVWNADILATLDPRALALERDAEATLAVAARPSGEGNVGLDESGRVVRLRSERFGDEARGADFLGIHVVGRRLRAELPEKGCLVGDVYIPALRHGARITATITHDPFIDIGTLASYLAANRAWLARQHLASWSAESATIDAPIDGSVVGAGAIVRASAIRCVVWPNARVDEPIADTIIAPEGACVVGAAASD
jgi:mannose-1-phosphate guanylyltransferase